MTRDEVVKEFALGYDHVPDINDDVFYVETTQGREFMSGLPADLVASIRARRLVGWLQRSDGSGGQSPTPSV